MRDRLADSRFDSLRRFRLCSIRFRACSSEESSDAVLAADPDPEETPDEFSHAPEEEEDNNVCRLFLFLLLFGIIGVIICCSKDCSDWSSDKVPAVEELEPPGEAMYIWI
jgi:hypothetical protein